MSPIRLGAPEPVDNQRPHRISGETGFGFEVGTRLPGQLGRTGMISTPHGGSTTPAFIAVGTKATVKAVLPESIADARRAGGAGQRLPPLPAARAGHRRRRPAGWAGS